MRAAEILRLVSGALQDLEPGLEARWPWEGGDDGRIGLLDFLNAAVRSVALQRPDATAITEAIRLEPGMLQKLPQRRLHGAGHDARFLIDIVRNMGADGETAGQAIVSTEVPLLLAWSNPAAVGATIENYAYDRTVNSAVYYVYPAVTDCVDVWVEATYSAKPVPVTSPDQCLCVSDDYATAIEHHILASVLSGDNEHSNVGKATYHMQLYQAAMGIKARVDMSWPNAKSSSVPGGE